MAALERIWLGRMKKAWVKLLKKKAPRDRAMDGMESSDESDIKIVAFNSSQLKIITNNFGEENVVTKTHFGTLYRGLIPHGWDESENGARRVTVKMWQHLQWGFPSFGDPDAYEADKKSKLMNEVYFLSHPSVRGHPNLVKLIGYCCEEEEEEGLYAVVYDLDPLDTLHNLISKDNFHWCSRIKVALELAHLLAFLHGHKLPYMVRYLDAMHIMVYEHFSPILFEFGTLTGGIMGQLKDILEKPNAYPLMGSLGYMDLHMARTGVVWFVERDVYAYGVLLLSIIRKKVVDKARPKDTMVSEAKAKYEREREMCYNESECAIADITLRLHPGYHLRDAHVVTKLGMQCMDDCPKNRPQMKEVV